MRLIISFLAVCMLASSACRKSDEITTSKDVKLSFSADTILFDTVFTTVGSVNRRIKIFNDNQKAVNISNIRLGGGKNSLFSLIINGVSANEKSNVQIGGKDSISIYVKATINPNNLNQPFIVEDSVLFNTNGNDQFIVLIAYGQNAIFVNGETIKSNTTWKAGLPHIINKSVTVAEGVTLNISSGTKVYFHGNSTMNVRGSLRVNGSEYNQAVFSSDRTEGFYENEAGQWLGIRLFASSFNNKIEYAMIKNAVVGITADSLTSDGSTKLLLANTTIKNMTVAAFVGYGTDLIGFNNLLYNSGQFLVYGVGGGHYNLKQNTFAGYNNEFGRRSPAVYFSDLSNSSSSDLAVDLINNIIWGVLPEELQIERKTTALLTVNVNNNIIKTSLQTYSNLNFLGIDPKFADVIGGNFRLQSGSPAINKGLDLSSDPFYGSYLKSDLNNSARLFPSKLGCYEH
ncbi:hypothetical protein [Pedobacter sp. JCM 36344]|uniref:hypothetical protein n=1 Tax=Pedobacter sp. JCM 36344 TaxID=3374280 RepID=UPI00397B27B0